MSASLAVLLAATVTSQDLPQVVDAAHQECSCSVVVAATSLEAVAAANRGLKGAAKVVRVSGSGATPVGALADSVRSAGAACGLLLIGEGQGPWTVTAHGACGAPFADEAEETAQVKGETPQQDAAEAVVPAEASPAEAAEAAEAVVPAEASAAEAAREQAPAPKSAPSLAQLKEYKRSRLVRDKMSSTFGSASYHKGTGSGYVATVHSWAVYDGGGAVFKPRIFAEITGDRAMADRLRKESNSSLIGGGLLLVGGVALTAVTWGPYMDDEGSAAGPLIGLTAATIGFSWPLFVAMSQEWINKYYTTSEADRRIDIYNDKLRERLGLDEEDVRDIDLQTRRSPVELDLRVGPGAVALSGRF